MRDDFDRLLEENRGGPPTPEETRLLGWICVFVTVVLVCVAVGVWSSVR